jgi:hypothetical protein
VQWLMASRGEALHLSENVAEATVRVWQPDRTESAPTPLQRGLVFVRRQPRMRFLFFCSRYWVWRPAAGQGTLLSMGTFPTVQCSTEKTRMGAEGVCETNVTNRSIFWAALLDTEELSVQLTRAGLDN